MENKPYHHLKDGTFRNPEGSPGIEDFGFNWSYKIFNKEKKKINIDVPQDHVINKKQMIIDYISGMTDRYILKIYNKR